MTARGRKRAEEVVVSLDAILAALGGRWRVVTGPGWALVHGDCLEVMAAMPAKCVAHMIGDPPYSEHTHSKQWIGAALTEQGAARVKTSHKGLGFPPITEAEAMAVAVLSARIVARWTGLFTDVEGIDLWRRSVLAADLDYVRTCLWDKVDGAPQFTGDRPAAGAEAFVVAHPSGRKRWNGGGKRNVYRHAVNGVRGDKPHPSTKPLDLMSEIVEDFTDVGDLILDPYCGSGSTGAAAIRLGRSFLGIERDPAYFEIACRRMRGDECKPRPEQPSLFGASHG